MSSIHTQIQFGAEFITLMVAAAGLALAALRPDRDQTWAAAEGRVAGRRWRAVARPLAVVAFLIAGTTAFLHGSLLVTANPSGARSIARLAGAVVLAAATPGWSGGRRSGVLLRVGVIGWAGAGAAELTRSSIWLTNGLLVGGSLAVGLALLAASRHSIAVRVAASAATTLLLVVLVVAIALSAVISSSLQRDELRRLSSRATIESGQVGSITLVAAQAARYVAGDLEGFFEKYTPNPLFAVGSPGGSADPTSLNLIQGRLTRVLAFYPFGGFAYDNPDGSSLAIAGAIDPTVARALLRNPGLAHPPCSSGGSSGAVGVIVEGRRVLAAATDPECGGSTGLTLLGTVLVVYPLDQTYLTPRVNIDPTVSIALVTAQSVLATSGPQPPFGLLTTMAARSHGTEANGNRFLAVVPVAVVKGSPPVTLVLSTPNTTLVSTRNQLYRTLFLIALGGTVLALGLAAFTGDRITARIRRLTDVASRIEEGQTSQRAGISGDDEVAVLGSAFDSMIDSVEEQAGALQAAADDETRLRNRLEAVVAGMSDALIAADPSGLITEYNRAAEELFARPRGRALGRRVDQFVDLVGEDGVALSEQLVDGASAPWALLGSIKRSGGEEVPVAVSSGILHGPAGEVAGRVLVIRDLRREREVEQMKTEFLSRVGHELRTPLTGIMGYADILVRREVPPERARQWNEEIRQSGRRLLRIVEMLEFFASSGAGRVLMRPEPLDTRALVSGLASGWAGRLPAALTIRRRVARDTPLVMADRRWLSMAIDELIDNAVKFSPDGGRILVAASPHGADAVVISVTDTGVGMTAEQHATVFTDFVQGDGSDTRRYGGLGLGLAVVRRVVEGLGGEVQSSTAEGRGSTFTIVVPAAPIPTRRAIRS